MANNKVINLLKTLWFFSTKLKKYRILMMQILGVNSYDVILLCQNVGHCLKIYSNHSLNSNRFFWILKSWLQNLYYIHRGQIALVKPISNISNIWKKEKQVECPTFSDFNIRTKIFIQLCLYSCQDKQFRIQFRSNSSQAYGHGMDIDVNSTQ